MGYTSTVGAALTKPELGRMKPKLTNLESPDFSRGECQVHTVRGKVIEFSRAVRIPRTYNRFKGLMAKLLKEGAVPKDRPLIRVLESSLKDLLESVNYPSLTEGAS